jgi:DNA replication protein DnaC
MRPSLHESLKKLRLSGLAASLDVRLTEARGNHLEHEEFLELLVADELAVRTSRLVDRRVRAAMFREIKSLDEFDFSFNPTIKRKQIFDLATCKFVRERADVLLLGPPSVGKSFLAEAIGNAAIKCGLVVLYRSIFDLARDFMNEETLGDADNKMLARYLKPDLLIIDDMGLKQLPKRSGVPVRDHHAPLPGACDDDDQQGAFREPACGCGTEPVGALLAGFADRHT